MTVMQRPSRASITGIILAGGAARRMGGVDKGLVPFGGRPLIEWVIAALRPQVGTLLINANRSLERYGGYGLPVIPDLGPGFQGPLNKKKIRVKRWEKKKKKKKKK